MPPRSAKKGSGGASGPRKTAARTGKGAAKAQSQPDAAAEAAKVEEAAAAAAPVVETREEVELVEEVIVEVKPEEPEGKGNGETVVTEEEDVKDVYEEEDKGERLELEDNEPEYEPEETAVDYGEKEMDDDGQDEGEGDEGEEGVEGDVIEDEEGDMVDEEMEDGDEDIEGEGDDENVEEHEVDGEEEEHHDVVKEHRKRKEFEVFVGGLDKDATEDDLRKVFSKVGEITEVRLMMNPQTKKNKGFAFLRFATVEQAKRAVSELRNPVVNGKQCGVAPSQDSDTLFLGNICKTWTKEHLKEKLKSYGVENIDDLTLVEDSNSEGMNRGFAFLEFASRPEAMEAYRRLQKRDVVFGVDRTAKVSFADSFIEPDDEIMAQVKTVFVDGLPAAWDEDRVKEYLKKYGKIEKIELARNMPSAKRKDFGFITFDTHDAAVACVDGTNNKELGEGDNKVKVRARLSRPLQRGRGKRVARGDFRIGRGASRGGRLSWTRPPPPRYPYHGSRAISGRGAPLSARGSKRPIGFRDRHPVMASSERARRLPPPERPFARRPPIAAYPKSSSKRDYDRRDEFVPRSRAAVEYGSRVPAVRRPSYREEYSARGTGYSDVVPRSASRSADRRPYVDEGYGQKPERPLPAYRVGRSRDYDSISGTKRPYAAMDDPPPRYSDVSMRQSRARLDYAASASSAQYDDAYSERLGRPHMGYGGARSSLSGQDSHGLYGSRQGMSYGGGSASGSDVDGMYSSSYSSSYLSRGSDVGGSSYSSLYSGRSLGGSGYMGNSGAGPYY